MDITVNDCDESVMSLLTSASTSVLAKFPALLGGVRPFNRSTGDLDCDDKEEDSENDMEEKQHEIRCCLDGIEEEVDLWKLRDLALSRGGLIHAQIRKQAWPKLVAAHEQILESCNQNQQNYQVLVDVSNTSIALLMKDVAFSIWPIEDHVKKSRQLQELALSKRRKRKVAFLPELTLAESGESDGPSPVKSIEVSKYEHPNHDGILEGSVGTFSPMTAATPTYSLGTKAAPRRKATKNEQKLLFNIILSVLRMSPQDNPHYEDDRYKYFKGLSDLAALLLINLESPSLTSLVLGQLAQWHLRDAMRSTTICVESALKLCFFPLLKQTNNILHDHISSCIDIPSFCLPWIQGWWCQQLVDVQIASRLVDVFLVSHALMPIYFSVAFICHPLNSSIIMTTNPNLKDMHNVLRTLPTRMMHDILDADVIMDLLEDMIEVAISLIALHPPADLVKSSLSDAGLASIVATLPKISAFQASPLWTEVASAPTDYAVLQHARAMRLSKSGTQLPLSSYATTTPKTYPRAQAAVGKRCLKETKSSFLSLTQVIFVVLFSLTGVLVITRGFSYVDDENLMTTIVPPLLVNTLPLPKSTFESMSSTSPSLLCESTLVMSLQNNSQESRQIIVEVEVEHVDSPPQESILKKDRETEFRLLDESTLIQHIEKEGNTFSESILVEIEVSEEEEELALITAIEAGESPQAMHNNSRQIIVEVEVEHVDSPPQESMLKKDRETEFRLLDESTLIQLIEKEGNTFSESALVEVEVNAQEEISLISAENSLESESMLMEIEDWQLEESTFSRSPKAPVMIQAVPIEDSPKEEFAMFTCPLEESMLLHHFTVFDESPRKGSAQAEIKGSAPEESKSTRPPQVSMLSNLTENENFLNQSRLIQSNASQCSSQQEADSAGIRASQQHEFTLISAGGMEMMSTKQKSTEITVHSDEVSSLSQKQVAMHTSKQVITLIAAPLDNTTEMVSSCPTLPLMQNESALQKPNSLLQLSSFRASFSMKSRRILDRTADLRAVLRWRKSVVLLLKGSTARSISYIGSIPLFSKIHRNISKSLSNILSRFQLLTKR